MTPSVTPAPAYPRFVAAERDALSSPSCGIAYERWPMIEIVSVIFLIGSVVVCGRLLHQAFDD